MAKAIQGDDKTAVTFADDTWIVPTNSITNVNKNDDFTWLLEKAIEMKHRFEELNLIQDRKWRTKEFKQCFLHENAISYLMNRIVANNDESMDSNSDATAIERHAVMIGNKMIDAGYISHVKHKTHKFKAGRKKLLFFKFNNSNLRADRGNERAVRALVINEETELEQEQALTRLKQEKEKELIMEEIVGVRTNIALLADVVVSTCGLVREAQYKILILEMLLLSSVMFSTLLIISYIRVTGMEDNGNDDGTTEVGRYVGWLVIIMSASVGCYKTWRDKYSVANISTGWMMRDMEILERIANNGLKSKLKEDTFDGSHSIIGTDVIIMEPSHERNHHVINTRALPSKKNSSRGIGKSNVIRRLSNRFMGLQHKIPQVQVPPEAAAPLIKARTSQDIPPVSAWPNHPMFLCANTKACPTLQVPKYDNGPIPIGVPFQFESELFVGKCLLRVRDLPTSHDPAGDQEYFAGRQRRFQSIVQGKFKKQLRVNHVLTGHEFHKPLHRLPPRWILSAGIKLIQRLAQGVSIDLWSDQPKMLSILAATSQIISVDMPGSEPSIADIAMKEDVSLLLNNRTDPDPNTIHDSTGETTHTNDNITISHRKKLFANPKLSSTYTYDTESIYTFDFYQNLLDCKTYSLDLGFTKIGVDKSLNGQPIQILAKMAQDCSDDNDAGKYLWSFQIW
eukprot:CAMPEP_0195521852 /NCGR_PEP_ID=MMETSP0794_2-20130614/19492_1 /TAXON_ID=515487 /ORGANISM="Stephanopyxis turris, Strain CCMP 815" /LENGTH=679 /DNA_ID=CAMNT_0040651485 /DNA_START=112 /DNA_END=2148 /DNA_ORIENTATION=+